MADDELDVCTVEDEPDARSNPPLQRVSAIVWGYPDPLRPIVWLSETPQTIGRDRSCSIELPSKTLSRRHAELRPVGKLWLIEDLGSRNGVFVNGKRVARTMLTAGDTLRIGEWIGTFTELLHSDAPPFAEPVEGLFCGPTLAPLLARAEVLAQSKLPLVLQGETGTGKELFARAIHVASRRTGRFVAVNCSVYQRENASAELFGYRRGAFTGAERAHEGHVQAADKGTLFLDEVSELAANVQPDLLRVLQEGEVMRLGESLPTRVDVRVVVATQEPLALDVERGRFRADVRARIEGAVIHLPPLRERREEVIPLFMHLLAHELSSAVDAMDPRLLEYLAGYSWPLNARELMHLVKKLVVLHRAGVPFLLPSLRSELPALNQEPREKTNPVERLSKSIRDQQASQEIQKLIDALERSGGNLSRAAAELKISRQHAYRLLKSSRERSG